MRAINHPVGQVTEALLRWWYRSPLEDDQGLSDLIMPTFTELCDAQIEKYRHGRVLLAAHIIALFRVDPEWTTSNLLPFFDWQRSELEARAAWEGFLWSPRLYRPLMEVLKPTFLDTALHYAQLGDHAEQYASLLTFAALDRGETFSIADLASATRALPQAGLRYAAQALVRAQEGAGDESAEYWTNRVSSYLRTIWPRTRNNISAEIAESLGRLCVAAQDGFPDALELLRAWLQPASHPDFLVHRLHEAGLCGKFPKQALDFLNLMISDEIRWLPNDFDACLEAIQTTAPELQADPRFRRLAELLRRHGGALPEPVR
jgi:hypothetical protein